MEILVVGEDNFNLRVALDIIATNVAKVGVLYLCGKCKRRGVVEKWRRTGMSYCLSMMNSIF